MSETTAIETKTNGKHPPAKRESSPISTIADVLNKGKKQLELALPKHLNADRLIRVALTAIQRSPKLLECTPLSIAGSLMQAAQLGLEPDGILGLAYLVPFHNSKTGRSECQLIAGYKGLMELARRSGFVSSIQARVVHDKDLFRYKFGLHPVLEHEPSDEEDPGPMTHAWALAHFVNGGFQYEVMSRQQIEKVRKGSKSANSGPWQTHYDEMAIKTVIRRLCGKLPLSPEAQRLFVAEDMAEAGVPPTDLIEGSFTATDAEQPQQSGGSRAAELAAAMGGKEREPGEEG